MGKKFICENDLNETTDNSKDQNNVPESKYIHSLYYLANKFRRINLKE